MATTTRTKRGFKGADCVRCGDSGTVSVDLHDVTAFRCTACDAEWTAEEVRDLIAAWQGVLAWIDLAPTLDL